MEGDPSACWSDRVTLPPLAASVPMVRDFVQDRLIEHDLEYLIDDVRLVANELATNATQHAKTDFTVRLQGLTGSVRLFVTDQSSKQPIRTETLAAATGGRGLNIVSSLSRDWGVTNGKDTKSVWASFALRSREPVEPGVGRLQGSPAHGPAAPLLSSLLHDVKTARAGLRVARTAGGAEVARRAQEHLVVSLTRYVEGLAARRLPVPYLLRDELRIYGRTSAGRDAGRSDRRP